MISNTLHCSRCQTPFESGDLRCSICGQAAPDQDSSAENPTKKVRVQVLRCSGCGAAIAYDAKHQAPACSFCGDVVKVETIDDPMEQTEAYLPFTLSREDARASLKQWLGTLGWFRPSDLRSSARLEELSPLWWVGWVFDAESLVSWTADSNVGAIRSAWAPHSGQTQLQFENILVSASRGLTESETSAITPGLKLDTATPEPEWTDNATLEQFDMQRTQARQRVITALQSMAVKRAEQHHVPGTRFRKTQVSVVVRKLITRRLAFPAYVLAYRYKNNLYRVVVCGQDGNRVIGSAPHSYAKIAAVAAIAAAIVLFVLLILANA